MKWDWSLDNIKNPSTINNPEFNNIFDNYFTSLSFEFNKKIDIPQLIDALEEKNKKVKYDLSNLTKCSIELDGLDTELIITQNSLDIFFTFPSTPIKLVEYFQNARLHLEINKIHLIESDWSILYIPKKAAYLNKISRLLLVHVQKVAIEKALDLDEIISSLRNRPHQEPAAQNRDVEDMEAG